MQIFLAITSAYPLSPTRLERAVAAASRTLPPQFGPEPAYSWMPRDGHSALYYWTHSAWAHDPWVHEDDHKVAVLTGYAAEFTPAEMHRIDEYLEDPSGGEATLGRSIGGIFSLAIVQKHSGSLSGIQGFSGLEPQFYTRGHGITTLSNRAAVSHGACFGPDAPLLDRNDVLPVLSGNFAIDCTTPLLATRRVFQRDHFSARGEAVRTEPRRLPRPRVEPAADVDGQAEQLIELMDLACRPLAWAGEPILRISGGKDSRILAAHFARRGIGAVLHSHNFSDGGEGWIADRIAEECGFEIERDVPPHRADDLVLTAVRGHRLRFGMPLAVPLHYGYDAVRDLAPWRPIVLGQAHHQRGGFARAMLKDAETIRERMHDLFVSPFLRPEYQEVNRRLVDAYAGSQSPSRPLTLMYLIYRDLRIPNNVSSQYMEYMTFTLPVYPLLDEEMVLFCDQLAEDHLFNLVSERLVFTAIKKLWPGLTRIPLSDDRFRFELFERADGHFGEDYEARDPALVPPAQLSVKSSPQKLGPARRTMSDYLQSSSIWPLVAESATPDVLRFIGEGPEPGTSRLQIKLALEFFHCAFGLATLYDDDRWHDDVPAPSPTDLAWHDA